MGDNTSSRDKSPCRKCHVESAPQPKPEIAELEGNIRDFAENLQNLASYLKFAQVPTQISQDSSKLTIVWDRLPRNAIVLFDIGGRSYTALQHVKKFEKFTAVHRVKKLKKLKDALCQRILTVKATWEYVMLVNTSFKMPLGMVPLVLSTSVRIIEGRMNLASVRFDLALSIVTTIMRVCYPYVPCLVSLHPDIPRHPNVPEGFVRSVPVAAFKPHSPPIYFVLYADNDAVEIVLTQFSGTHVNSVWYYGPKRRADIPNLSQHPLFEAYNLASLTSKFNRISDEIAKAKLTAPHNIRTFA